MVRTISYALHEIAIQTASHLYEIFTLLVSWAPFYRQMLVIAALH